MHTTSHILVINGGSSSIKFALYATEPKLTETITGSITRIGVAHSTLQLNFLATKENITKPIAATNYKIAVASLLQWIKQQQYETLIAIGHRVVHGGPTYNTPQLIDQDLINTLQQLSSLDPEHLPEEILLIEQCYKNFPKLLQFACFDTEFYQNLPRIAQLLPIPRKYNARGIRRYGFHGLSYTFLMNTLHQHKIHKGRIILAHLGSGSSLTAILNNEPIDTSMAFTPNSGIPMSTRSGDLDPGLIGYLARTDNMNIQQFNTMIAKQSGLLGVSEVSGDMHDLLNYEQTDNRAAEAIELFCYRVRKEIGALAASLNGLDVLVFTGGIGENSATIRARICDNLGFLGIDLDNELNQLQKNIISSKNSPVVVHVIRTNEEYVIATIVQQKLIEENKLCNKH